MITAAFFPIRGSAAEPNIFNEDAIAPKGETYTATVPETLDLAERAKLAVHGLTSFINPKTHWPYTIGYFNCRTPFQSDSGIPGFNNCGKLNEALIMARLMSGSRENLDVQEQMLNAVVSYVDEFAPQVRNTKNMLPMSRTVAAFMALSQIQPSAEPTKQLERLIDLHIQEARIEGDKAYYISVPSSNSYAEIGFVNYGDTVYQSGGAIRALARWYAMTGDERSLDLAQKLKNFLLQSIYWTPEREPKAVVGSEHGHFNGWVHTYALYGKPQMNSK